jgi:hypothetical protein
VYLALLPIAALLGTQSLVADGQAAATYRSSAAIVALLSVVFAHWLDATPMVSIVGVVVAMATVAAGTLAGEKPAFVLGLLIAAVSLGNFCLQAFKLHSNYAWVALALIGIAVIFSASLIEKGRTGSFLKSASLWGRLKPRTS